MLPTPSLLDPDLATSLLHDADGDARAALICWSIALGAFAMLRIPREVLLGCLIVAGATVGLAAMVVDVTPSEATASSQQVASARSQATAPRRGSAPDPMTRDRPY